MDIKAIIKRHGFKQKEVAALMGIKASSLSANITRGNVSSATIHRIAEVIGADYSEFFEDETTVRSKKMQGVTLPATAIESGTVKLNGLRYRVIFIPINDKKNV